MTTSVENAARHLCELSGWTLSNLQIQKMLYLADMHYVGTGQGRLVPEDFEAWDFGPVLPSLYHTCKAFGSKPVPNVFWNARSIDGTPEAAALATAWEKLRGQSPGQLVSNTHWSKGAWARRYQAGQKGIKITEQDMADEFQRRIASVSARSNAA